MKRVKNFKGKDELRRLCREYIRAVFGGLKLDTYRFEVHCKIEKLLEDFIDVESLGFVLNNLDKAIGLTPEILDSNLGKPNDYVLNKYAKKLFDFLNPEY